MKLPIRCIYQVVQNECIKVSGDPDGIPAAVLAECRDCIDSSTCPLSQERIHDEAMQIIVELRGRIENG